MKDRLHIRNAEAVHLARILARQTGKTISEIILDALRQYRPARHMTGRRSRIARWRRLLQRDRVRRLPGPGFPVEALYDQATGLPK